MVEGMNVFGSTHILDYFEQIVTNICCTASSSLNCISSDIRGLSCVSNCRSDKIYGKSPLKYNSSSGISEMAVSCSSIPFLDLSVFNIAKSSTYSI